MTEFDMQKSLWGNHTIHPQSPKCLFQSADNGEENRSPATAPTVRECAFVHTSVLKQFDLYD